MVSDQFYQEIIRKNERQEHSNGSQGSRHNGAPHFFVPCVTERSGV